MISTLLLTLIAVSLLSVLIGAYRVSAKARYADRARYVIKSFADQFLTQDAIDTSGNPYPLFVITVNTATGNAMARGDGMGWNNDDGSTGQVSTDAQHSFYYVNLADPLNSGISIQATVTRQVSYLYANSGSTTLVAQSGAAGYLLEGDFVITYPYLGQTQTQSISAVRAVP